MEKVKILELIDKKIKENELEAKKAQEDLLSLKGMKPKNAEEAGKFLLVKDKILFHRSIILALEELKHEINEVK